VKSLFLRLLVSLWLAMALLVGAFALIHAWAFPPEAGSLRQKFAARSAETRGENALLCTRQGLEDCGRVLKARDPRDARLALYESGKLVIGEPIGTAAELDRAARASVDRNTFVVSDNEYGAVVLARDPRFVVAWQGPVWSRWVFFIAPDTLPYRLLAIVLVTGLVAVLLARYLSRPIARLRRATQQMAAGDLSVRVANQLAGADSETRALGHDLDAMAERIQALLESERRLRRDISHELRSPLTRLNISLELIRRKSSAELAPAFERVERDTARLDEMIRELLHLNRLEAEGIEHAEAVDLAALARGVADDGAIEAERQGARLSLKAGLPCFVRGNPELLRRAIENVVRNAIRFTGAGEPVELELDADDERVELRVRDHGPGVPEETLGKIFKPFYRVEGDRSRNTGGTGLGLAIVEQSMLLHGGRVHAENHREGGLVVVLELPVVGRSPVAERAAPGLARTSEAGALTG
jgi:two-component system, OmpR family, sensor kinase